MMTLSQYAAQMTAEVEAREFPTGECGAVHQYEIVTPRE